jgi:hypothetical protein
MLFPVNLFLELGNSHIGCRLWDDGAFVLNNGACKGIAIHTRLFDVAARQVSREEATVK